MNWKYKKEFQPMDIIYSNLSAHCSVRVCTTPSLSPHLDNATTNEQSVKFLINSDISMERTWWIQATIEKIFIINDIIPAIFYKSAWKAYVGNGLFAFLVLNIEWTTSQSVLLLVNILLILVHGSSSWGKTEVNFESTWAPSYENEVFVLVHLYLKTKC